MISLVERQELERLLDKCIFEDQNNRDLELGWLFNLLNLAKRYPCFGYTL